MDKLYIVSDSIGNGSAFATRIGLSQGNYKVITHLIECDQVPDTAVFVSDQHHPLEAVAITTKLKLKQCIYLGELNEMSDYMNKLISNIDYVNRIYADGSDYQVRQGVKKLQQLFEESNLTQVNGFEFTYMYNLPNRYYYVVPQSPKSKVIVNLIKWKIYDNKNKIGNNKVEGIKINDPKGVLKNAGKILDSGYFS